MRCECGNSVFELPLRGRILVDVNKNKICRSDIRVMESVSAECTLCHRSILEQSDKNLIYRIGEIESQINRGVFKWKK